MAELETQLDPLKLFVCRDNAEAEAGGGGLPAALLHGMDAPASSAVVKTDGFYTAPQLVVV